MSVLCSLDLRDINSVTLEGRKENGISSQHAAMMYSGLTVAAHSNVFIVSTVVSAPHFRRALRNERLTASTVEVVQPDGTASTATSCTTGVWSGCSLVAKLSTDHLCISRISIVIADGTILPSILYEHSSTNLPGPVIILGLVQTNYQKMNSIKWWAMHNPLTPVVPCKASITHVNISTVVADDTDILIMVATVDSYPAMPTVEQWWFCPSALQPVQIYWTPWASIAFVVKTITHCTRVSKLTAGNIGVPYIKIFPTDSSPTTIVENFQPTLILHSTSNQSNQFTETSYYNTLLWKSYSVPSFQ